MTGSTRLARLDSTLHSRTLLLALALALVLVPVSSASASLFASPTEVTSGQSDRPGAISAAVEDVDADGLSDLIVDDTGVGGVAVLLARSGGGFEAPRVEARANASSRLLVKDVDGDGRPDIIVNSPSDHEIVVARNRGDGMFGTAKSYSTDALTGDSFAVGDVTGDGRADLVVTSKGQPGLGVMAGDGHGGFGSPVTHTDATGTTTVALGDLNGDGRLDAVIPQGADVGVALGGPNGLGPVIDHPAAPPLAFPLARVSMASIADMDGDGAPDLVVNPGAGVSILLGTGDGGFEAPVTYPARNGGTLYDDALAVGDVNRDGRPDVAVNSYEQGVVIVLPGTGGGALGGAEEYQTGVGRFAHPRAQTVAIADYNGDHAPDLVVPHSDEHTVALLRNRNEPELGSASYVPFDPLEVQSTSGAKTVAFSNIGSRRLTVSSVSLGGPAGDQFALSNDACSRATLGPLDTCTVDVRFTPTTPGFKTASIDAASTAPGSPFHLAMYARAGSGDLVRPAGLTFDAQRPRTASEPQHVKLTNTGQHDLTIGGVDLGGKTPGDFRLTDDHCLRTLAPGDWCTFKVQFAPSSPWEVSASVTVTDSALDSPQRIRLVGAGGIGGTLAIGRMVRPSRQHLRYSWPGTHLLGTTTHTHGRIRLISYGAVPVDISGFTLGGDNPNQFTLTDGNCPAALNRGESCTITAHFAPTTIGPKTATVHIDHDAFGPQDISLSGTAVDEPRLDARPDLGFADQPADTRSAHRWLVVRNRGTQRLSITSLALSGPDADQFRLTDKSCSTPVRPGDRCSAKVWFAPSTAGAKSAQIDITDNAPGNPHTVTLSGTATAAPSASARAHQPSP